MNINMSCHFATYSFLLHELHILFEKLLKIFATMYSGGATFAKTAYDMTEVRVSKIQYARCSNNYFARSLSVACTTLVSGKTMATLIWNYKLCSRSTMWFYGFILS